MENKERNGLPQRTVRDEIASCCEALRNCEKSGNDWAARWRERIARIEREILPSGSGIDSGTRIDAARSGFRRIVLETSFHHMNEGGYYDGWTEHRITCDAAFHLGTLIRVSGRDRNGIKEYLAELFDDVLAQQFPTDFYREEAA